MARELNFKYHRLVFSGVEGLEKLHIEYRVIDGDYKEKPQRKELENVNFGTSIQDLFEESVRFSEKLEDIS